MKLFWPVASPERLASLKGVLLSNDKKHNYPIWLFYTGHWVYYGYGMVCLYKADYMAVGGFDLHIKGWGGEDVDLYKKVIKHGLRVWKVEN